MFSFVGNLKLFIMEANQCRLNNVVNYRGQITTLTKNEMVHFYRFSEWYDPIPLTEEILLKCGFEITGQTEHPNNIWTVYGEECKFELEHITSFYLYDNKCFGTKVQYLHQLQNLYFALTNEELTVNL